MAVVGAVQTKVLHDTGSNLDLGRTTLLLYLKIGSAWRDVRLIHASSSGYVFYL